MKIRRRGEMVVSTLLKLGGVLDTSHLDGWFHSLFQLDLDPTVFAFGCKVLAHQTVDITKTFAEKDASPICDRCSICDVLVIYLWYIGDAFILLFIYDWSASHLLA